MSPIPLGILAASGGAPPVAAGAYDLLETTILSSDTASVSFTNLNSTYGSDYKHLQIRSIHSTDRGSDFSNIGVRFNDVISGNYYNHRLEGTGSIVQALAEDSCNIRSSGNGKLSATVADILDPFSTSKNTTMRDLTSRNNNAQIVLSSNAFFNTNAIDKIEFFPTDASNIFTGSRFSLYGIKAA